MAKETINTITVPFTTSVSQVQETSGALSILCGQKVHARREDIENANTLDSCEAQKNDFERKFGLHLNASPGGEVSKLNFNIAQYAILFEIKVPYNPAETGYIYCDASQMNTSNTRKLLWEYLCSSIKEVFPGRKDDTTPTAQANFAVRIKIKEKYQELAELPNSSAVILFAALIESAPDLFKEKDINLVEQKINLISDTIRYKAEHYYCLMNKIFEGIAIYQLVKPHKIEELKGIFEKDYVSGTPINPSLHESDPLSHNNFEDKLKEDTTPQEVVRLDGAYFSTTLEQHPEDNVADLECVGLT